MPAINSANSRQALAGPILVVGGGHFGRLALSRLGKRVGSVVEPKPSADLLAMGVPVIRRDGIAAVAQILADSDPPRWIVPCLPRHLLAEWLRLSLAHLHPRPVPWPLGPPPLAQALSGPDHVWYLSLTDTLCPDDCPEPAQACPKTGQPRGLPLFSRLRRLRLRGVGMAILRSHQLAPGVGGFKSREMLELRERVGRAGGRWLVAAACRCHGVAQAWELDVPSGALEA